MPREQFGLLLYEPLTAVEVSLKKNQTHLIPVNGESVPPALAIHHYCEVNVYPKILNCASIVF